MKLGYHDDKAYLHCPICGIETSQDAGEPTPEERVILNSQFHYVLVARALRCENQEGHRYLAHLAFHKGSVYVGTTHSSIEITAQGGIRTNAPDRSTFRGLFTHLLPKTEIRGPHLESLMENYEAVTADFGLRKKGTTNLLSMGRGSGADCPALTRFGPEIIWK